MIIEQLLRLRVNGTLNVGFIAFLEREFFRPIRQFDSAAELMANRFVERRPMGIGGIVASQVRDHDPDFVASAEPDIAPNVVFEIGVIEPPAGAFCDGSSRLQKSAPHSTTRSPDGEGPQSYRARGSAQPSGAEYVFRPRAYLASPKNIRKASLRRAISRSSSRPMR